MLVIKRGANMKIIVDAMGGDNAPESTVLGCIKARDEYGINIILSGNEQIIKKILDKNTTDTKNIDIINAEEIITNDDKPVLAIKKKKDSSLVKALSAVKDNEADAIVSAGSTGALLSGGLIIIGRMDEIERPAICTNIPNTVGGYSLLIDSGANVDCKAAYLYDFAIMANIYSQKVMGIESPRISLANIGTEEGKGDQLTKETYELLKNSKLINFNGNIESRDILRGAADVIVCDGFIGNMILKTLEGTAIELMKSLKKELSSSFRTKLGAALAMPALNNLKNMFDFNEIGGAPLLGLKAPVIKAHGSSNETAIKNAIRQAKLCVENNVVKLIEESIVKK